MSEEHLRNSSSLEGNCNDTENCKNSNGFRNLNKNDTSNEHYSNADTNGRGGNENDDDKLTE